MVSIQDLDGNLGVISQITVPCTLPNDVRSGKNLSFQVRREQYLLQGKTDLLTLLVTYCHLHSDKGCQAT
jgi:hypothetical protein